MKIFFTADHHFGHSKIIEHEGRPFQNADEMDEVLISNWNSKISSKDHVYHLGDVSLRATERTKNILERLNGKIFLIRGNHDKPLLKEGLSIRFEWIKDYHFLKLQDDKMIALMHYCMRVWERKHYGSWHLYGHSHTRLPEIEGELALNVGVDCWNFYPVSLETVTEKMNQKLASSKEQ